jgi:hypothetical protein
MSTRKVDLQLNSLLWLINRQVFHPRGYALGYNPDDGTFWLAGDGTEPWVFGGDGSAERGHLETIKEVMP